LSIVNIYNIHKGLVRLYRNKYFVVAFAKDSRIIGGEDADIKDFPYLASIRLSTNIFKLICSGTIISHVHILSAGHCFMDFIESDLIIFVGSSHVPTVSNSFYKIRRIIVHPAFVGKLETAASVHNDIAIVTVNKKYLLRNYFI
jgi:trypsin